MRRISSTAVQAVPVTNHQVTELKAPETIPNVDLPAPNFTAANRLHTDSRLTWQSSKIHKVQYNSTIQQWIDFDEAFANWVRTCVMLHADNDCDETVCSIPDQWRNDVGDQVTIVTANYLPVRPGTTHQYKEGVYHVMN